MEIPSDGALAALQAELEHGRRYDLATSCLSTLGMHDPEAFVTGLLGVLADDGWIYLVEPDPPHPGERLAAWIPPRFRRSRPRPRSHSRSHKLQQQTRDLPQLLRQHGFIITDLHRHEVASAPRRWRRFVKLRATRQEGLS